MNRAKGRCLTTSHLGTPYIYSYTLPNIVPNQCLEYISKENFIFVHSYFIDYYTEEMWITFQISIGFLKAQRKRNYFL